MWITQSTVTTILSTLVFFLFANIDVNVPVHIHAFVLVDKQQIINKLVAQMR